jgi:hypothetical protein
MMIGDERDDHDAFLRYRFLRARAPEGLTPKSVMVVILVTVHPMGCRGKRVENAGGGNQPLGGGSGGCQSPKVQVGCRWTVVA